MNAMLEGKVINKANCSYDAINRIVSVSLKGLVDTFDEKEQLFRYRIKRFGKNPLARRDAYRYTIIAALGLQEFERHGGRSPIDVELVVRNLIAHAGEINNIGDAGLLIWLCSLSFPEEVKEVFQQLDLESALSKYREAFGGSTMELSWFLAGLAHMKLVLNKRLSGLERVTEATYKLLVSGCGEKGIFKHQSARTFKGMMRGRIGNFADQVYPIYALSRYSQAYNSVQAYKIALDCAKSVCGLQGPLGQWWWHYDSVTGKVVGRYPVFAVHQDGMAPMALFTLGEVTGIDFSEAILRGLGWITGGNEVGYDLVDISRNAIWRSLCTRKCEMIWDELLSFLGMVKERGRHRKVRINFQCWPYHLGWILYAFGKKKNYSKASMTEPGNL